MRTEEQDMVSVVIATYNSEKVLPKVLKAIREQDYPQEKIEILVVDGGSTDSTLEIAEKFRCKIYDNPQTEPVHARLIGFRAASGKYMMGIDHDEVLLNRSSISNRMEALKRHPECKIAHCSGYKRPAGFPRLSQYISEFGDPFSLFVYCQSKDYKFLYKWVKKYSVLEENDKWLWIDFKKEDQLPLFELFCTSTIYDREWLMENSDALEDEGELAHAFYIIYSGGFSTMIFTRDDPVEHYTSDTLKAYFPKIKWRVCNNVHFQEKGANGFSGREKYNKKAHIKKYLFIPYSLIVPISFAHSLYLAVTRKNAIYLMHPILCLYTAFEILYQMTLNMLKITPAFTSYDGKKKIKR